MKPTIRDIAKRAGISVSAVSLALNNKSGVSERTRELIQTIARELNYAGGSDFPSSDPVPSQKGVVEFLKVVRHGRILNGSHKVFIADYLEGVTQAARALRYGLQVRSITDVSEQEIAGDRPGSVRGILILGTELTAEDIDRFERPEIPVLFLDTWHEFRQFDFVDMDNPGAVFLLMSHLYANGHRSIGFVNGNIESRNLNLRERGYREALAYLGLPFRETFLYRVDTTMEGAYRDMNRILGVRPALPTALFIGNDTIAYGVMRSLREHGLRIPQDISVAAFDDLPASALTDPPLTTIRVGTRQMGALAFEILARRIEREPGMAPVKALVGSELIVRESVRHPA